MKLDRVHWDELPPLLPHELPPEEYARWKAGIEADAKAERELRKFYN